MDEPRGSEGRVSVVIPTYDRRDLTVRAVSSVLAQTVQDLEVLVVDDGSHDDTTQFLSARFLEDPRVRVIRQANAGPSAARNRGLREVTGSFVAFLDSDDTWVPWKLELQLAVLAALPDVGMVWTDMRTVDGSGAVVNERHNRIGYRHTYETVDIDAALCHVRPLALFAPQLAAQVEHASARWGMLYPAIIAGNVVPTPTVVLRRSWADAVGGFDEELRVTGEDHDYHLRTARLGPVAFLEVATMDYRTGTADQLTRKGLSAIQAVNYLRTVDNAVAHHPAGMDVPRRIIRGARAHSHRWLAGLHYEAGERGAALQQIALSLAYRPGDRTTWRIAAKSVLPHSVARGLRATVRRK